MYDSVDSNFNHKKGFFINFLQLLFISATEILIHIECLELVQQFLK
jgi:hypothetical protein